MMHHSEVPAGICEGLDKIELHEMTKENGITPYRKSVTCNRCKRYIKSNQRDRERMAKQYERRRAA